MDLSFASLFAGLVFGAMGVYLIKLGRSNANIWHIVLGLSLLVFPYFVSGAFLTWAIGAGLLGLAYFNR